MGGELGEWIDWRTRRRTAPTLMCLAIMACLVILIIGNISWGPQTAASTSSQQLHSPISPLATSTSKLEGSSHNLHCKELLPNQGIHIKNKGSISWKEVRSTEEDLAQITYIKNGNSRTCEYPEGKHYLSEIGLPRFAVEVASNEAGSGIVVKVACAQ